MFATALSYVTNAIRMFSVGLLNDPLVALSLSYFKVQWKKKIYHCEGEI